MIILSVSVSSLISFRYKTKPRQAKQGSVFPLCRSLVCSGKITSHFFFISYFALQLNRQRFLHWSLCQNMAHFLLWSNFDFKPPPPPPKKKKPLGLSCPNPSILHVPYLYFEADKFSELLKTGSRGYFSLF